MAHILLMETDNILAKNLQACLAKLGHSVDWQVDPQEAIISVDVQPVDLVVLDLVLAGRSGTEFLYEFRSYPDWLEVPIIIYSNIPAHEVGQAIKAIEQLNVEAFYHKPTTGIGRLSQIINQSLQVHESVKH